MATGYKYLTETQVTHFLEQGYVVFPKAIDPDLAKTWVTRAWKRLDYDPQDKATWKQPVIHMPAIEWREMAEVAPHVWGAAQELCGGAERIASSFKIGDSFIVNLTSGEGKAWIPPSAAQPGWHKDGDFFRHFLDSPEQGLLTLILWSDIQHKGGATYIAPDSVGIISKYLAAHPEGVPPTGFDFKNIAAQCQRFLEMTGQTGDILLLHPFMLHTASYNALQIPRFLTNPCVALREPMNFNRDDPDDFSLVEKAVLRGLGVERLDFQPSVPREKIVPERVRIQQKMLEEEAARASR